MDDDIETLSRDELIVEIKKLHAAVREHRDSSGHALCRHRFALWSLLR
jgi:hypothetical protein